MPRQGVVEAPGRRAYVHDVVRVDLADDVDPGLPFQCTHPIGIGIAALAKRPVDESRVAGDQRRRLGKRPRMEQRRRIDRILWATARPHLEMKMLDVLGVLRIRADDPDRLTDTNVLV